MTRAELREFARAGAQARLQAISEERAAIIRTFPDLRTRSTARADSRDGAAPVARRASKRRRMSAAERKAVGRRMRAYWAKRRAERATTKKRKGSMSAEARKRQAERMKGYWAAKRAQKDGATGVAAPSNTERSSSPRTAKKSGRKQGRNRSA
jgi:hypothetical protein